MIRALCEAMQDAHTKKGPAIITCGHVFASIFFTLRTVMSVCRRHV